MPQITGLTTKSFLDLANTIGDDTKIKLNSNGGVKTAGWITWKSTDRAAMDAFVTALRRRYGDDVADSMAARLDYVDNPKPLTARLVKETVTAAQDQAAQFAHAKQLHAEGQAQQFCGFGKGIRTYPLRQSIDAAFDAIPAMKNLPPEQAAIIKDMVMRKIANNIMQNASSDATFSVSSATMLLKTTLSGTASSMNTVFQKMESKGQSAKEPELQFLQFLAPKAATSTDYEAAIAFIRQVKAENPGTPLSDVASFYKAMCTHLGKPQGSLPEVGMEKALGDLYGDLLKANQQLSASINSRSFEKFPFGDAVMTGMKDALALFPDNAGFFGDLASKDTLATAVRQSGPASSLLYTLQTSIKESLSPVDAGSVKAMTARAAKSQLAQFCVVNMLKAPLMELAKDYPFIQEKDCTRILENMCRAYLPADLKERLLAAKDQTELGQVLKEAKTAVEPFARQALSVQVCKTMAIQSVRTALVNLGYTEEEVTKFNDTNITNPLSYMLADASKAANAKGQFLSLEGMNKLVSRKVASFIELKTALFQSVQKMDAPVVLKEHFRMEVITNCDLKFADMLTRSLEIAKQLDPKVFEDAARDRTGITLQDAFRSIGFKAQTFKTKAELAYEPFEWQSLVNNTAMAFTMLHPEVARTLSGIHDRVPALEQQLLAEENQANDNMVKLNIPDDRPDLEGRREVGILAVKGAKDAISFANTLFGVSAQTPGLVNKAGFEKAAAEYCKAHKEIDSAKLSKAAFVYFDKKEFASRDLLTPGQLTALIEDPGFRASIKPEDIARS